MWDLRAPTVVIPCLVLTRPLWASPQYRLFQPHVEGEPEKKEVSELRSELWEKEMKLTDIRLEALNSAHQLEQLRETMHNMQVRHGPPEVLAPPRRGPRAQCHIGPAH